jgi:polynucleotide 5'-kinase involved in rRNA processing
MVASQEYTYRTRLIHVSGIISGLEVLKTKFMLVAALQGQRIITVNSGGARSFCVDVTQPSLLHQRWPTPHLGKEDNRLLHLKWGSAGQQVIRLQEPNKK